MYHVIDKHTKQIVGKYASHKRAINRADKLDNIYGAYRYIVRVVTEAKK